MKQTLFEKEIVHPNTTNILTIEQSTCVV